MIADGVQGGLSEVDRTKRKYCKGLVSKSGFVLCRLLLREILNLIVEWFNCNYQFLIVLPTGNRVNGFITFLLLLNYILGLR